MKKTDHLITPWNILIKSAINHGISIEDSEALIAPRNLAANEYNALSRFIKDMLYSSFLSFDNLMVDYNSSDINPASKTDFYSYIQIPVYPWRKTGARFRGGTYESWFRISLLDGQGMSERLFNKTPDTICTQNEKLFLHILSALSEKQLIKARNLLNSITKFDDIYINDAGIKNAKNFFDSESQAIDGFHQACNARFRDNVSEKIFPYMLNKDYIGRRQMLGLLRIIDTSKQSSQSYRNFIYNSTGWLNILNNDIFAANKSAMSSHATTTILSLSRTLVGIDDLFSPFSFNAPHRTCYCDFDNCEYYVLSPNECRWLKLFRQIHPENQGEFIVRCIRDFDITSIPEKVDIDDFFSVWKPSV